MPDSTLPPPASLPIITELGTLANWGSAPITVPLYWVPLLMCGSPFRGGYSPEPSAGLWVRQPRGKSLEWCVRTPPPLPSPGSHRALKTCSGPQMGLPGPTLPMSPFLSLGHQAKPALWGECTGVMQWICLYIYPDLWPQKQQSANSYLLKLLFNYMEAQLLNPERTVFLVGRNFLSRTVNFNFSTELNLKVRLIATQQDGLH